MRRICICLMSMLMFLWTCCLAENDMNNIREICAKRSEWKSEYNSNGRRIDVDVPIVIPDVKKIPVISVKPYYAVNGQCLVSRVEPMEKIGEEGWYSVYEDCELLSYMGEEQTERGKVEVLDLDDYERAGMLVDYSAPFNKQNSKTKYTNEIFYPYERELSSVYAEDNPISLEEAIKYLEKIIEYFYPGESSVCVDRVELRSRLHQVEGMDDYILGDYVSDYLSGTYNLGIRQMMNGIPIYMDVGGKMSPELTKKKPELWKRKVRITGIASNFFEFMNEKSFMLNSIWMKKSNVIEEDVPLKDIDVIIKKIEEKILAGNIRNVYALKLGYCVYFDKLDETGYVLYPIWICECAYVESAKEELRPLSWVTDDREQPYYKRIVINAQTAEIEPMVITDEKQIYCPTVVTW